MDSFRIDVFSLRRARVPPRSPWPSPPVLLSSGSAHAQEDDTTPLAHTPGAPAGSYALSDLERINLFNGKLSFYLPLLTVGGRGDVSHTLGLSIDTNWEVKYLPTTPDPQAQLRFNRWRGLRPGYGPGTLSRYRAIDLIAETGLIRATFMGGDQTQYEFRDEATEGQAMHNGHSRGRIFRAHDGSMTTFLFDNDVIEGPPPLPTGSLFTPDGVHYRIENGVVRVMRDRNGNEMRFDNYVEPQFPPSVGRQVGRITDALNRVVTIDYATPANKTDQIHFKGFDGAPRTIRVSYDSLAALLTEDSGGLRTLPQLFPEIFWFDQTNQHNPTLVSAVTLPDQRQYRFRYNQFGELAEVTLPTGGKFRYFHGAGRADGPTSGAFNAQIYRRLLQRAVFNGGVQEQNCFYGQEPAGITPNPPITVVHTDPRAGNAEVAREVHSFFGRASDNLVMSDPMGYPVWRHGREFSTQIFGPGLQLLRTVDQTWQQFAPVHWSTPDLSPANDPRVVSVRTTLGSGGAARSSTVSTGFSRVFNGHTERFENPTSSTENGFDDLPLRRRETIYVTHPDYTGAPHLRRLPLQVRVLDGANMRRAQTDYTYDVYVNDLVPRDGITGHHPDWNDQFFVRGNVTRTARWLNTTGGAVASEQDYDIAGNVVRSRDPEGHETVFDFRDRFGPPDGEARSNTRPAELPFPASTFAFPTEVANPAGHVTVTQFDYYIGRAVDHEDANGVVGSAHFADNLDRLTRLVRAELRPERTSTDFEYVDTTPNAWVHTRADMDPNTQPARRVHTAVTHDSLGREFFKSGFEAEGDNNRIVFSDRKEYDARGRVAAVANPFRANETMRRTLTAYDALDRVIAVTFPDTTQETTAYGPSPLGANVARVTDAAARVRLRETDAIGRLTAVTEDPGAGHLDYRTTYAYDVFDNVVQVDQGTQRRSFAYDSLSRLICESTPEARIGATPCNPLPTAGALLYTYDGDDNLLTRKDARNVTAFMAYDPLHRLVGKGYDPVNSAPGGTYKYDEPEVPFSKGRLTLVDTPGVSKFSTGQYDALGRVLSSTQTVGAATYTMAYTYDQADHVLTERYPSGRTLRSSYDGLGRPLGVAQGGYVYGQVAGPGGYSSHGAVEKLVLGNSYWQHRSFNCRLQQSVAGLGDSSAPPNVLKLDLSYGTSETCTVSGPGNNGNLLTQTIVVNGVTRFIQSFTYDQANRLQGATEKDGGNINTYWSQGYAYDRWGNRAITSSSIPLGPLTPTSPVQFDPATNRINVPPWAYDDAGNQTRDGLNRTFAFDAENRQTAFASTNTYRYDVDGRRIAKTVSGSTSTYVYNAFGRLVGEYGPTFQVGTTYVTSDHLGSSRIMTSHLAPPNGVVGRIDYLPFGDEISASIGGRGGLGGYGSDAAVRHKFTGNERDLESGLDYFAARYYSGPQGRFTSVDPVFAWQESIADPQRWNRYAYALNRPLTYVDRDGELPTAVVGGLVGGAAGFLGSAASQFIKNDYSFNNFSWRDAGAATLGGTVSGALAGGTLGLSRLAEAGYATTVVVSAGSNVVGGTVTRATDSKEAGTNVIDGKAITVDAIAGGVGGGAGRRLSGSARNAATQADRSAAAMEPAARAGNYGAGRSRAALNAKAAQEAAKAKVIDTVVGAKTTNVLVPVVQAVREEKPPK